MRHSRRHSRWHSELLLAAVVIGIVGCSGAGSDAETASAASADPATEQPAGVVADADEPKSLDDYLGLAANVLRAGQGGGQAGGPGGGVAGGDQEQILEQQRLIQQQIQVCMQGEGFTYVPEVVGDDLRFFGQAAVQTGSAADYAATQGFGISTRFDEILDGEVEVTNETDDVSANDTYLATLSEGEADAWQVALRGQPPERNAAGQLVDAETGEVLQGQGRGAVGGCTEAAQLEVRGDFSALVELQDEFAELDERIESDPRIAEIRREWIDCMSADGFDYDDEAEARADINAQVRPLLQSFFGQVARGAQDGDAAPGQGQRGGGGGNVLATITGLQLTAEQEAELEALQDLERSIAVASLECQGDTAIEIAEITLQYEDDFVAANLSTLELLGS